MIKLDEIRKILSNKKYNKSEIARSINMNYQVFLYALKDGSNPPYKNVEKISNYIENERQRDFINRNNPFLKGE